jgi:mannan endo-1,4-beta-mannosidase
MNRLKRIFIFCILHLVVINVVAQSSFVKRRGGQFYLDNKPYYYVGANYWYGGYLGLEKDKQKGVERLRKELDFLKAHGVTNLRVLTAVEGSGQIHGVQRVKPPLQTTKGVFDEKQLDGLDVLLYEMGKRNMKAVLFLSNNWEWSGGFLQYVNWNGLIEDTVLRRRLTWDEQRDYTSKFYSCKPCQNDYLKQVQLIINRTNNVAKKKYRDDVTIMAWELVNEPRPMRSSANEAYKQWIFNTAAYIKSLDKSHLVTLGHEGDMATDGDTELYEQVHADNNVDYLTIHIWPKNWGWFKDSTLARDYAAVVEKTSRYIDRHVTVARRLQKPLVIEEFGLPRDGHSFDVTAATTLRDDYYKRILAYWQNSKYSNDVIAGINFWAFSGTARPITGQVFWKEGDDYMGDPPMEEQGLNGVFDTDITTWKLIDEFTNNRNGPANK